MRDRLESRITAELMKRLPKTVFSVKESVTPELVNSVVQRIAPDAIQAELEALPEHLREYSHKFDSAQISYTTYESDRISFSARYWPPGQYGIKLNNAEKAIIDAERSRLAADTEPIHKMKEVLVGLVKRMPTHRALHQLWPQIENLVPLRPYSGLGTACWPSTPTRSKIYALTEEETSAIAKYTILADRSTP